MCHILLWKEKQYVQGIEKIGAKIFITQYMYMCLPTYITVLGIHIYRTKSPHCFRTYMHGCCYAIPCRSFYEEMNEPQHKIKMRISVEKRRLSQRKSLTFRYNFWFLTLTHNNDWGNINIDNKANFNGFKPWFQTGIYRFGIDWNRLEPCLPVYTDWTERHGWTGRTGIYRFWY